MSRFFWICKMVCLFSFTNAFAAPPPFVTVQFMGRLGNNMFQVAAACALAWDHGAEPVFWRHGGACWVDEVFSRYNFTYAIPRVEAHWWEPSLAYHPVTYNPNMEMRGYFQSEKYFAHYRKELLELFAPRREDLRYIIHNYSWILSHPNAVGVQVRHYKGEDPNSTAYIQYGRDYLEKAMSLFPESSLFVVSSDNLEFARASIPRNFPNVYFLEGEPCYIDLFILSMCKHNIISNSSFGWWGAWLNKNPEKKVIYPSPLFTFFPTQDYCPKEWIPVKAQPDRG